MVLKTFKFKTRVDNNAAVDPSTGVEPQRKPTVKEIAVMIGDVSDYCSVHTSTDNNGDRFVELHINDDRLVLTEVSAECAELYEEKILNWLVDKHLWILGKLIADEYVIVT